VVGEGIFRSKLLNENASRTICVFVNKLNKRKMIHLFMKQIWLLTKPQRTIKEKCKHCKKFLIAKFKKVNSFSEWSCIISA